MFSSIYQTSKGYHSHNVNRVFLFSTKVYHFN